MTCETKQPETPTPTPTPGTSTKAQRTAIVIAGRVRGLSVDDLRGLAPAGSLRALSFAEASALLDRLNQGTRNEGSPARVTSGDRRSRGGRKPSRADGCSDPDQPAVVKLITPAQRATIETIRCRLGWTTEHLDVFCARYLHLPFAKLARGEVASKLITMLTRVLAHVTKKAGEKVDQAMAARSGDL